MGVETASIDLNKIDKSKIIEGKNGAKYINIAIIDTPDSQYNTKMIVQSVSKEEREKGVKGEIIGGVKLWADAPKEDKKPKVNDTSLPF